MKRTPLIARREELHMTHAQVTGSSPVVGSTCFQTPAAIRWS